MTDSVELDIVLFVKSGRGLVSQVSSHCAPPCISLCIIIYVYMSVISEPECFAIHAQWR